MATTSEQFTLRNGALEHIVERPADATHVHIDPTSMVVYHYIVDGELKKGGMTKKAIRIPPVVKGSYADAIKFVVRSNSIVDVTVTWYN